ncbi:hypothetical protein [Streptomyces sp. NPDC058953]|uniref:hypothetical protein n=1 Tax=unclassified Streptomyces TaxID=2593676 RepID=UPI0036783E32
MSTTSVDGHSLTEQAALRRLPEHQYTDRATVEWIAAHRPAAPRSPRVVPRPATRALVRRAGLPPAWLAEPRLADGVHGVRHCLRTAALAAVLAEASGLDAGTTATAVVAAAVHDCRRRHDRDDRGHGERAADWLTERADTVWGHFGLPAPPPDVVARAAAAVRLHDVPYAAFGTDTGTGTGPGAPGVPGAPAAPAPAAAARTAAALADYHRDPATAAVCDVVKAADALDRYRLPRTSWWPDARQVRLPAFDAFRNLAFTLVVDSERARIAGAGSTAAVLSALAEKDIA